MQISVRLIDRLRSLPLFVEHTIAQAAAGDANRRPDAGGFSLLEHVCHLRDYDEEGGIGRIARMLNEEAPFLPDFQGETIARERRYCEQDLTAAVQDFLQNRSRLIDLASSLSAVELARTATLESVGVITVAGLLQLVADHDAVHRLEIDALVHETDLAHLRSMAEAFTTTFNARDLDGLMRFYGDTYVDINLRQPVQSFDERRAYFSRLMERGMRIDVHPDEILIDGAMALVRGHVLVQRTPSSRAELRYLEVARKGSDGSWKAVWGMDGPIQDA